MVSVTCLLVFACAVAANAFVSQQPSEKCTTILHGSPNGYPSPLQPATMKPGISDWKVYIPAGVCPNGVIGEKAEVCDFDVPPAVQYVNDQMVLVHRMGNLQGYGYANIVVYCLP